MNTAPAFPSHLPRYIVQTRQLRKATAPSRGGHFVNHYEGNDLAAAEAAWEALMAQPDTFCYATFMVPATSRGMSAHSIGRPQVYGKQPRR